MIKRQFRFSTAYFVINGVHNIPGLIICSGHGYAFKTYCCKTCGELFAVDLQLFHFKKTDIETLSTGKLCPSCSADLKTHLVEYPENIFFGDAILKNNNAISPSHSDEKELREVYELT